MHSAIVCTVPSSSPPVLGTLLQQSVGELGVRGQWVWPILPTYELTEALKITDSINDSRSQHQIRQSVARVRFYMLQIPLNSRSLSMENFRVFK